MGKMKNKEQYKLIFEIIAFCISLLALICVVAMAILVLFFPLPYAKALKSIGLNNVALSVYENIYTDSKKITDGYDFLCESIYAKNDKYIVKAYETVIKDEEFSDFINYVNNSNFKNYENSVELIAFLNEYDFLKGKYIQSLFKTIGAKKALNEASEDFVKMYDNFNSIENDKSFVLNEYFCNISCKEDALIVPYDIMEKMIEISLKFKNYAQVFLNQTNYDFIQYRNALECSVRYVEIYTSLKKISKFNSIEGISNQQILENIKIGDSLINSILKKHIHVVKN